MPYVGSSNPPIMRRVVVLPQPEGPSMREELPFFDVERKVVHRGHVTEQLRDALQAHVDLLRHAPPPYLRPTHLNARRGDGASSPVPASHAASGSDMHHRPLVRNGQGAGFVLIPVHAGHAAEVAPCAAGVPPAGPSSLTPPPVQRRERRHEEQHEAPPAGSRPTVVAAVDRAPRRGRCRRSSALHRYISRTARAVAVPDLHQPVVDVLLVGVADPLSPPGAPRRPRAPHRGTG